MRELAYRRLRRAILSGYLKPMQWLNERELAAEMGVSTTPIKEALRRLEAEGLVRTIPRRGTQVTDIAETAFAELVVIRAALEGVAARLAAMKATDELIAAMAEQIHIMEQLLAEGRDDDLFAANTRFHGLIHQAMDNGFLYQLVDVMKEATALTREEVLAHPLYDAHISHAQHKAIFEAIRDRDGARAELLTREHVFYLHRGLEGLAENPMPHTTTPNMASSRGGGTS